MSMDPSGAIGNVKARLERLKQSRAVYLAAKGTMVDVSNRVWGRGELTNGSKLAYDEDYELYAYTPPSPRKVTGRGKPYAQWKYPPKTKAGGVRAGSAKIKGGFYESYLSYKKQQGRADLPFELTGRLRKAYFGGTDTPEPTQDSDDTVTIRLRGEQAGKYLGLTDTKGPFLRLTNQERDEHNRRVLEIYQATA